MCNFKIEEFADACGHARPKHAWIVLIIYNTMINLYTKYHNV